MIRTNRQRGFSLLELLVSIVVFSIGLLGVAGLQIVSKQSSFEGRQRSLASQVAYGMLEDMRTNGAAIAVYQAAPDLGGNVLGALPVTNCRDINTPCTAAQKAGFDLWFWEQIVDGNQAMGVQGASGGLMLPTVCIDGPPAGVAGIYSVSVAWYGSVALSNPAGSQCGAGTGKYGGGPNRRVLQVSTFIDPNF